MNPKEFEKRRKEQIRKLLDVSTPEEKQRIRKALKDRKWRRELDALEQRKK